MERNNSLHNLSKENQTLNRKLQFLKNNFMSNDHKSMTHLENLTFREKNEEKENKNPNELNTIMKKEKKSFIINFNNNSGNFFENEGIIEKSTPGFPRYQPKTYKDDFYTSELSLDPERRLNETKSKKNKKSSSCLWESFTNLRTEENNANPISTKYNNSKSGAYLNTFNLPKKMKVPNNNFWKKFVVKNEKTEKSLIEKIADKTEKLEEKNQNNDLIELKSEISNLNDRMSRLEKIIIEKDEKMEKLAMKYRKLKTNNLILQQNIKLIQSQTNFNMKNQENKLENANEKTIKTLNDFEISLRKSILSASFDFKSKKNSNSLKSAGNYYEALKFYEKAIVPIKEKLLLSKKNEPNSEEKRNIEIMRDMLEKFS